MPVKNSGSSFWKPIAFALLVVVIAILAYALGRGTGPVPAGRASAVTPHEALTAGPAPAEARSESEPTPSSAEYTVPATPAGARESREGEAPPAELTPASLEEEPRENPESCLTLEATPNRVEVYGASGPAVQLAVKARNGCGRDFFGPGTYFRVYATAPGGFDLASATGRFAGSIPAWGSAETLIAVTCDPTRVARYRVELWR